MYNISRLRVKQEYNRIYIDTEVSIYIRNEMVASNFLHLFDFFVIYLHFKELDWLIHLGVFGCESTGVSPAINCLFDISVGLRWEEIVHGD